MCSQYDDPTTYDDEPETPAQRWARQRSDEDAARIFAERRAQAEREDGHHPHDQRLERAAAAAKEDMA